MNNQRYTVEFKEEAVRQVEEGPANRALAIR
jgi:transposase-like protein